MGKYMRKAKVSGEVAVMEVSHQSSVGVRTRARTLAAAAAAAAQDSSRAYLELRSRRLEKPLPPPSACKPCKDTSKPKPNPSSKTDSRFSSQKSGPNRRSNSGSVESVSTRRCSAALEAELPPDAEVSFGENILEADSRDRWVLLESVGLKIEPFLLKSGFLFFFWVLFCPFFYLSPVFSVSFIHLSVISKSSFAVTCNDFSPCLFAYYYISLSMVYLDLVFIFSRNCSVFSATLRC